MINVKQLAEWVIRNRRGIVFQNYTYEDLVKQINHCISENAIRCVTCNGLIVGICCGEFRHKEKIFFVQNILTTKPGVVKRLVQDFVALWPGYTLEGVTRKNRPRYFNNPIKLLNRL